MDRDYASAVAHLNSRRSPPVAHLEDAHGSDDVERWLTLIGLPVDQLELLKVIHVAGTNGKGHTCALTDSILRAHGRRHCTPLRVGRYTSPHLFTIRERICVDGLPISEQDFACGFYYIWDRLPKEATPILDIPRYLQLLFLLACHVFSKEKVDVAIFEAHCGGEYDATNIVPHPTVAAVTPISTDHVHLLGPTLRDIAWHKAGIFKDGCQALSAMQAPEVANELIRRAKERGAPLAFVGTLVDSLPHFTLAQQVNLTMAVHIIHSWLRHSHACLALDVLSETITAGVNGCVWPGRFDRIDERGIKWFVDGAHNEQGIRAATEWYVKAVALLDRRVPVVIFGHHSKRDVSKLLNVLVQGLRRPCMAETQFIVTTTDRNKTNASSADEIQTHAEMLVSLRCPSVVSVEPSVEEAIWKARTVATSYDGCAQVLILGSLHLASAALLHLSSADDQMRRLERLPDRARV